MSMSFLHNADREKYLKMTGESWENPVKGKNISHLFSVLLIY